GRTQAGQGLGTLSTELLISQITNRLGRRTECNREAFGGGQNQLGNCGLVSGGGETINSASLSVDHLMTSNSRVIPVAEIDSSVRSDGDIRRTEPGVPSTDRVFGLHGVACTLRRNEIGVDQALAGLSVNQLATISGRRSVPS